MHAEIGVWSRPEDHTVACTSAQIKPLVIPSEARNLGFCRQLSCRRTQNRNSHCGNHLEILWEALIDGILPHCMFIKFRGQSDLWCGRLARIPKIRLDSIRTAPADGDSVFDN